MGIQCAMFYFLFKKKHFLLILTSFFYPKTLFDSTEINISEGYFVENTPKYDCISLVVFDICFPPHIYTQCGGVEYDWVNEQA